MRPGYSPRKTPIDRDKSVLKRIASMRPRVFPAEDAIRVAPARAAIALQ